MRINQSEDKNLCTSYTIHNDSLDLLVPGVGDGAGVLGLWPENKK